AKTTEKNIARYREQLDKIGFSFDWDREVRTCDPDYYKWTQWTFIQLFKSWFNKKTNKADSIDKLIKYFEENGNVDIKAATDYTENFSSEEWKAKAEAEKQSILMNYRLAYLSETHVNWCPALGTVLANDEVKEGFSVRGNHPVERKKMNQWFLRITAYAERLLKDLDKLNWSESLKEIQKNWIGRSEGASIFFDLKGVDSKIEVFTSRPDTIFGATFMVLAPEHELTMQISTKDYLPKVKQYIEEANKKSDRERMTDVKKVSGQFTGAYCVHPFSGKDIPVYISDYVLAGYGTGAIMAVPAHDSRDYDFARHFDIPIIEVVTGGDISKESYDAKEGKLINSSFLDNLDVSEAIPLAIKKIESMGIGKKQVNYRLRDAIFSRQRYWGEPFPVYYKDGIPYVFDEKELPLELPPVDAYLPTESGQPPLARAKNWETKEGYPLECNTMPGFAGSSAYYIRYMDPRNDNELVSENAINYWRNVDLYVGGAEHATGHLIYARFWNKFLYDIGIAVESEPFKKLINQGMIQGRSNFVYRIKGKNHFVSYNLRKDFDTMPIHVDVNIVSNDILDIEAFRNWNPEFKDAEFTLENGRYICGWEVEKMSKSFHNVVNPDDLIERYGADTLRLYEMFLGPVEQAKPWDTKGIEGVFRFIRKLHRLFHDENNMFSVSDDKPSDAELKILHKTIKKVEEDIERFSFNTSISAFMVCVNELTDMKCNKKQILEPLLITLSSFAPHICEELWHLCGNEKSIVHADFPNYIKEYIVEDNITYPVSFNGKTRFKLELPADMKPADIEKKVMETKEAEKYLAGKQPKKVIVVPGRIVNIVV
ncbi:MAG: leucine--tRNA ligase, partial [Bacteroidales bacterium]